eukprot:5132166-Prorocentrum_lima.AAC.1
MLPFGALGTVCEWKVQRPVTWLFAPSQNASYQGERTATGDSSGRAEERVRPASVSTSRERRCAGARTSHS